MSEAELRMHRCCFTGHRPDKMTMGEKEIKPMLEKAIDKAIEDGYKAGDVPMMYGNILGYKKGADGKPEIVPEEAATIRFIYDAYLEGNGYLQIARMLEEKGYTTKRGNTDWRTSAIKGILTNEKYKGDVIMQKTFVSDLFTKQKKVNRGDLPMYLVRDHHEPIIEPAVFDKVQVEIAKRNSLKALTDKGLTPNSRHSQYALTGLIECGECGAKYVQSFDDQRNSNFCPFCLAPQ